MISCSCDDDGAFAATICQFQNLSHIFISLFFFSIPLFLLYFLPSPSSRLLSPYPCVLSQFALFVILSGATHLFTVYSLAHHSSLLILVLTVLKFSTALISGAISLTLATLFPQIFRVMIREGLLMKKTKDLSAEIELIKRREKLNRVVLMVGREVRKSLDRRTTLLTCMDQLYRVLALENCGVFVVDHSEKVIFLREELKRRDESVAIPAQCPELGEVFASNGVKLLGFDSRLGKILGSGEAAAIRLPLLAASDFGFGPEIETAAPFFPVMVLVLSKSIKEHRTWGAEELSIVEGVMDQLSVALSHAKLLEESLILRKNLMEQTVALRRATEMAAMANEAIWSFRGVMNQEIRRLSLSISANVSKLKAEEWKSGEQRRAVAATVKLDILLSDLIQDSIGVPYLLNSGLKLKSCSFSLASVLNEVTNLSRFLCAIRGLDFQIQVFGELPSLVLGDEMRISQSILHLVGKVLGFRDLGAVLLSVYADKASNGSSNSEAYVPLPEEHSIKDPERDLFVVMKFQVHGVEARGDGLCSLQNGCKKYSQGKNNSQIHHPMSGNVTKCINARVVFNDDNSEGSERCMNFITRLPFIQQLPKDDSSMLVCPRYMDPENR